MDGRIVSENTQFSLLYLIWFFSLRPYVRVYTRAACATNCAVYTAFVPNPSRR